MKRPRSLDADVFLLFKFPVIIIACHWFVCEECGPVTKLSENGEYSFPKERENLSYDDCFSTELS